MRFWGHTNETPPPFQKEKRNACSEKRNSIAYRYEHIPCGFGDIQTRPPPPPPFQKEKRNACSEKRNSIAYRYEHIPCGFGDIQTRPPPPFQKEKRNACSEKRNSIAYRYEHIPCKVKTTNYVARSYISNSGYISNIEAILEQSYHLTLLYKTYDIFPKVINHAITVVHSKS